MARGESSLPPGRRQSALTEAEARRAEEILRALDYRGAVEYNLAAGGKTKFVVRTEEGTGREYGLIVIGADFFPGSAIANPNSVMDILPVAAHEITHHIRWEEGRELPPGPLDEAITSLQAVCTFKAALTPMHIEQLVSDALNRLVQLAAAREA